MTLGSTQQMPPAFAVHESTGLSPWLGAASEHVHVSPNSDSAQFGGVSLQMQLPPDGKSFVWQQYVAPELREHELTFVSPEPSHPVKSPHQQLDAVP